VRRRGDACGFSLTREGQLPERLVGVTATTAVVGFAVLVVQQDEANSDGAEREKGEAQEGPGKAVDAPGHDLGKLGGGNEEVHAAAEG